jgi:hypothetical protein
MKADGGIIQAVNKMNKRGGGETGVSVWWNWSCGGFGWREKKVGA